ncbi:uncharacterized protein K02A2.6-like [Penaeus monodon]|uniref:uncharacterized protein K02A2.6-like n=1 Tax=Penaeus monodon TaxID=6687 RepID=UPI0018A6E08E|nr:uncharacterized protein K02A2.6-like [Penaeus monodon]
MRAAAREDSMYIKLLDKVTHGFPANFPSTLRQEVLSHLHDSHRGVEVTKRRARQTVWWPGINSDITNAVRSCEPCQVLLPSQQQEPMLTEDAPTKPFESVSADFFSAAGKSFLVYVDQLSGWHMIACCGTDTTAAATISFFRRLFRDLGVPLRLHTDGGPQFSSRDFNDFLCRWGVRHDASSPHYPQSNGLAEAAVKAVKHLIMKFAPSDILNEAFDRGLLELRNTPRQDGRSPEQILFGHPLRSCVPAHRSSFAPEWQAKAEDCDRRAAAKALYDSHAKPLQPLQSGYKILSPGNGIK